MPEYDYFEQIDKLVSLLQKRNKPIKTSPVHGVDLEVHEEFHSDNNQRLCNKHFSLPFNHLPEDF